MAQPIQKHLLDWFVVRHHYVADGVAAYEVTNLFRQVLGVIPGALQGLRHEDDLEACLALRAFRIFNVA